MIIIENNPALYFGSKKIKSTCYSIKLSYLRNQHAHMYKNINMLMLSTTDVLPLKNSCFKYSPLPTHAHTYTHTIH